MIPGHPWTSEEFERWLALQTAMGWTVRNPEAIEKIRAALKKGERVTPMERIEHDQGH